MYNSKVLSLVQITIHISFLWIVYKFWPILLDNSSNKLVVLWLRVVSSNRRNNLVGDQLKQNFIKQFFTSLKSTHQYNLEINSNGIWQKMISLGSFPLNGCTKSLKSPQLLFWISVFGCHWFSYYSSIAGSHD